MKLLIATTNQGKLGEYKRLLADWECELLSLQDVSLQDKKPLENGKTFKENAKKKALFYRKLSGLPTLADDAGLLIDYLDGEPGVHSRRWPGYEAKDEELVHMALEKLKGVPRPQRTAHFVVEIAFALPGRRYVQTFQGKLDGYITEKLVGKIPAGYPFRAIFQPEGKNILLRDMSRKDEFAISHRKQALDKARSIVFPR